MSYHIKTILGEEFDQGLAEELKEVCQKETGAFPQVGIARKDNPDGTFSICTNLPQEEYFELGDSFHSQLFELDKREFNNKRRGFCYAGDWTFEMNFTTGMCWNCLSNSSNKFNFFKNPDKKLELEAVGMRCNRKYCSCCNLQAWGVMPDHEEYSNLEIYNRPEAGWIKEPFLSILNQKLYETNERNSEMELSAKQEKECLRKTAESGEKSGEKEAWRFANKHLALFLMMNQWVKVKQEGKYLSSYFEKKGYRRIAIYGMSYAGETLVRELKDSGIEIAYGIDRNAHLIYYVELDVVSLDDDLDEVDAVVVTAISFFDEIAEQLRKRVSCPVVSLKDILYEM